MMRDNGCLSENKEILVDNLTKAFEDGVIDINILGSALGKQQLDESFMHFKLNDA